MGENRPLQISEMISTGPTEGDSFSSASGRFWKTNWPTLPTFVDRYGGRRVVLPEAGNTYGECAALANKLAAG